MGDGDVSIAALTSGAHGASFRRAGFRDAGARFSEKYKRERPSRLFYTILFILYQYGNQKSIEPEKDVGGVLPPAEKIV